MIGRRFSLGPPVSFTNKTDSHDITEILFKGRIDLWYFCFLFCGPLSLYYTVGVLTYHIWGRRGRDRMVVGFTTTCAINANHH